MLFAGTSPQGPQSGPLTNTESLRPTGSRSNPLATPAMTTTYRYHVKGVRPTAMQPALADRVPLLLVPLLLLTLMSNPLGSQTPSVREQTADQQVHHVLNRLGFGPRPGDVAAVRAMGVDAWIARQLTPEKIDDRAADQFISQFTSLTMSGRELLAAYPPPAIARARLAKQNGGQIPPEDSLKLRADARKSNVFLGEIASSRVARAVLSERQLNEVMVDFWENHFNVFAGKNQTKYFIPEFDNTVIRPNALGNFRDLLGAVAKSPAMLYYLDNWQSEADSGRPVLSGPTKMRRQPGIAGGGRRIVSPARQRPQIAQVAQRRRGLNENYARELMELHTMGVDGGYTQQDVIEVARALTGWTLDGGPRGGNGSGEFVFRPQVHDAGAKVILGKHFPAGRGVEEGEAVLDLLARHPATARFIATKLVCRFVSDVPPEALVARAAAEFTRTDGNIREVVRVIVTSNEFFSTAAYRAKVKSPFELVTSALRIMNASGDLTPRSAQLVSRLGQPIFGHLAPNGYPEVGDEWMNTGAILNRINFGQTVAAGRVPGVRLVDWPAARELSAMPREQQVDGVIREILGGDASVDTRQVLLTGTNPFMESHSNTKDLSGNSMDPDTAPLERVRPANGLAQILGLALGAPEFQRR